MPTPKLSQEEVKKIKLRVDIGERYRDKLYKPLSNRAWARYNGEDYGFDGDDGRRGKSAPIGRPPFRLNFDWAIIQTKYCAISFNNPDVSVEPQTDDAVEFAAIARHALKYEWEHINAQAEVKKCLLDRLVGGICIAYTGWELETEALDDKPEYEVESVGNSAPQEPGLSPKELQDRDGYLVEGGRLPILGDPTSLAPETSGIVAPIEYSKIVKDQPIVTRIDPLAFFVDPECANELNKAPYCGYVEYRSLDDIKRDPRFKNVKNLKGSAESLREYLASEKSNSGDGVKDDTLPSDIKRVKLIHYYDKQTKIHAVLCSEHDKPLLVEEWSWEFEGYPFVVMAGSRSPNDFWPMPEMLFLEHPIRELEQSRALQAQFMRMAVPKLAVTGEPLQPQQRKQAQSPVPYTIIELHPGQSLQPIPLPQNIVELQSVEKAAKDDMQTIGGMSQYDFASAPTKRMTTTEVNAIQAAGGPRVLNDRQMYETFCSRVLSNMLGLLMQNSSVPRRLPIYDPQDHVQAFGTFDSRQIRGKFKVAVHMGSTTAPNSSDTLESIGFLLQSIGPIIQMLQPALQSGVDLRPVLLAAIKAIPGIRDVSDVIAPLETQMAQQHMMQMMGPQQMGAPQALPPGPQMPPLGPPPGSPINSPGAPTPPNGPGSLLTPDLLQALTGQERQNR